MDDSASTLSVVSHQESLLSDGYAPSSASSFSHLSEPFSTAHFIVDLLAEDQNLGLLIRNNIVEDPRGLARLSRDLRDMLESYGKDLRGHSGDAVGTAAGDFVLTSPRQLLNLLRQRFYPSPRGLGIPERGLEEFRERKVDLVEAYLKNSRSAAEIEESRLAAKEEAADNDNNYSGESDDGDDFLGEAHVGQVEPRNADHVRQFPLVGEPFQLLKHRLEQYVLPDVRADQLVHDT